MLDIERAVLDFVKTFGHHGIFNGCEPKMERKSDPIAPEVQARDKNGAGLKWTALVAVRTQRNKNKILSITLVSPSDPCANIHLGQTVIVEGLEMGLMPQEKGVSQFWSASAIKPVQVQAPQAQPTAAASR